MRLDDLYLWYLADPEPRYVGALNLNPAVILSSRADLADTKAAGGG
jgi:hypothetical protein